MSSIHPPIHRIDCVKMYWQIPLAKESQPLTAFKTKFGNFSYRMTPMGLRCATATCQKLLEFILRRTHRFAGVMVDDVVCFSKSFEKHIQHVRVILERLRKSGLTANAKKCEITQNRINLLALKFARG